MKSRILVLVSVLALTGMASAAMVMHLEADSLGLADGASVGTWTDLSGSGNDATQGTAGAQPTYVAVNGAYNNHATVSFDGTDDWMDLNNSMVTVDNFTLFIVGHMDITGVNQYFISGQGGGGNDRMRIAGYNWNNDINVRVGNIGGYNMGAGTNDGATHVMTITGTSDAWLDLGSMIAGQTNTAGALNPSALNLGSYSDADVGGGNRDFLHGDMAEVILYNEILSATDVETINAQLYAKYVPEPATMILLGLGSLLIRRKR
jgi:hypothetical protein